MGLVVRRGNRIVMEVILRTANGELRKRPLIVWGLHCLAILRVDGDRLGEDLETIWKSYLAKPMGNHLN